MTLSRLERGWLSHTLQGPPALWKVCDLSVPSDRPAVGRGQVFGWQCSWVAVRVGKKVPGRGERALCSILWDKSFFLPGLSFPI